MDLLNLKENKGHINLYIINVRLLMRMQSIRGVKYKIK